MRHETPPPETSLLDVLVFVVSAMFFGYVLALALPPVADRGEQLQNQTVMRFEGP